MFLLLLQFYTGIINILLILINNIVYGLSIKFVKLPYCYRFD